MHDPSGWLDGDMHTLVRELLLHTMARYHLHCPSYCLMPDHGHFLWMGLWEGSDQLRASRFFRRHWNCALKQHGVHLQAQGHDHVLQECERQPDVFENSVLYIFKNPMEADLVDQWNEWPYHGAILPGFPDLPSWPIQEFWKRFWKIHNRECARFSGDL
jgi:putative transposase